VSLRFLAPPGGVEWFTIIGKVDISGIIVTEKTIIVDGQNIVLNIVKPENAKAYCRFYVFMGRLGARRFPTHQRMVRDLVVESGAAAVFVNYTRSPEAHYPVAINQRIMLQNG
jgi:acetyl esterase/lipase